MSVARRARTRVYDRAMRNPTMTIAIATAIAAGCGGGDGGGPTAWQAYASPGTNGVTALWAFAPDDVWAGSQIILHFDGTSFKPVDTPPIGFVADFWGFAPNDLYAVSGASLLHWDGTSWAMIDFAGAIDPSNLTAVWGTSGGDLWIGDDLNGHVHHWDGTAWSTGTTQTVSVADLWGVPGSAGGAVYAGGTFGLSRWSGTAWMDIGDDNATEAVGVWGFADDDVWAVSDVGTLAHWTGAPVGWTDTLPASNPNFEDGTKSVWGAAPDDVWAAGDGGAISHWDGAAWSQVQVGKFPYYPCLNRVHGSSAGDVWVAGLSSDGKNTGVILHHQP
jgi:hypothetical protein